MPPVGQRPGLLLSRERRHVRAHCGPHRPGFGGKVSAQTVVEAAAAAHAADGQALREEQDTAGKRVTKQVQAYIRKRGNESYCAGVGDESRKQKMAATAEEMAAARVNSLNAAMPKGASRVDPSIRGRW